MVAFSIFVSIAAITIFASRASGHSSTLSGIPCEAGSLCSYNGEKYSWCWTKEKENKWGYCCHLKETCEKYANDELTTCIACKKGSDRNGVQYCIDQRYACRSAPQLSSVNNFQCAEPCRQSLALTGRYSWCPLAGYESEWDWCCYVGRNCAANSTCPVADDGKWSETCRASSIPDAVPSDFSSPATPFSVGALAGVVAAVGFVIALLIAWCCLASCEVMEKEMKHIDRVVVKPPVRISINDKESARQAAKTDIDCGYCLCSVCRAKAPFVFCGICSYCSFFSVFSFISFFSCFSVISVFSFGTVVGCITVVGGVSVISFSSVIGVINAVSVASVISFEAMYGVITGE